MFTLQQTTAIITGASSGLGAQFARQLAPNARRLLLIARTQEPMQELAAALQQSHPALQIEILSSDLATPSAPQDIQQHIQALAWQPNLLINNAGLGDYGPFADADPGRIQTLLSVNINALVHLTHHLIPLLHPPAAILNVSSLASTLPLPDSAIYAASKAFVSSFSEALAIELEAQSIHVTHICPGPTPTAFSSSAKRADGTDIDRSGQDRLRIPPHQVVAAGLNALQQGKTSVFPGTTVKLAGTLFRILPRPLLRRLLRNRYHRSHHSPT
jgi:short-subunit dehydrogenase